MRFFALSLLAFLGTCAPAFADPDRVSFLLGSHHVGAPEGLYDEVNPGVFLTWEGTPFDVSAGVFHNSYGGTSFAALGSWSFFERESLALSVFVGAAYYGEAAAYNAVHFKGWIPLGGLEARYRQGFVQVMPSDGKIVDAIVTFGLTFDLD